MATYYVSTSGNDSNPGTIGSPFASWAKLNSVLVAGDTAYIRGGTYQSLLSPVNTFTYLLEWTFSGSGGAHITVRNYPGESPIFDMGNFDQINVPRIGVHITGTFVDFIGLRFTNMPQIAGTPQANSEGMRLELGANAQVTLTNCEWDHIQGAGCRVTQNTPTSAHVTFTNCDSHHNGDPFNGGGGVYGNADGFDANGGTVTYIGCRSWWNSDDGFDTFYNDSFVTYRNCWSFWNGYVPGTFNDPGQQADGMGFKWGSTTSDLRTTHLRTFENCLAFQNKAWGFDQNVSRCVAWFYNNTSYQNGRGGWATGFGISPRVNSILRNNASYLDPVTVSDMTGLTQDHNSWNGFTPTAASFLSLSTSGVDGPRQSDGSLPVLNFLHLSVSSNLINKGVDVGLAFDGPAPDLGAYETGLLIVVDESGSESTSESGVPVDDGGGVVTSITINFIPCDTMPVGGYNILYRIVGSPDYTDAGFFTSSPAVISVSAPTETQFEGVIKSDCGDVAWTTVQP